MNEKEAHERLAERLGVGSGIVPYLVEIFLDNTIINPILPETIKKLGSIIDLRPGTKILDLACGKGGVTLPLVHIYKAQLTGVDIMPEFIREAWSRAEYTGLYPLCDFRTDDAAEFTANTQKQWDAVFLFGSMTIIWPGLEDGLQAVGKLIRPGGHLVLGEPYRKPDSQGEAAGQYLPKEQITEILGRFGKVSEILDDGDPGWEAYSAPQRKNMTRLKEDYPDNSDLIAFLDQWEEQNKWDMTNMGFAVWVVKTG